MRFIKHLMNTSVNVKRIALYLLLFGAVIFESNGQDESGDSNLNPTEKMSWWREARFGMFIHWGVYAVPAGEHQGETTTGNSEWIMLSMKIPVDEYQQYAREFNPVNYDPEQWVLCLRAYWNHLGQRCPEAMRRAFKRAPDEHRDWMPSAGQLKELIVAEEKSTQRQYNDKQIAAGDDERDPEGARKAREVIESLGAEMGVEL